MSIRSNFCRSVPLNFLRSIEVTSVWLVHNSFILNLQWVENIFAWAGGLATLAHFFRMLGRGRTAHSTWNNILFLNFHLNIILKNEYIWFDENFTNISRARQCFTLDIVQFIPNEKFDLKDFSSSYFATFLPEVPPREASWGREEPFPNWSINPDTSQALEGHVLLWFFVC